jgi:hypothetical protein
MIFLGYLLLLSRTYYFPPFGRSALCVLDFIRLRLNVHNLCLTIMIRQEYMITLTISKWFSWVVSVMRFP